MIPSIAPPTPILMLTMNSLALTKAAVASVLAQDVPVRLLVVDNGSMDGTREWLRTQSVDVVAFSENIGVSAAWNHGLRYLFDQCKHDAVMVVNNDVQLRPETAKSLLADGGGFVTAVSVDTPDAIALLGWEYSRRPHPDFSCWLMRRNVWERIGEFDESFAGAYYEDNDYHVRMFRAGVEAYTIGIPFYHYGAGTLKNCTADARARIHAAAAMNKERFKMKYGCYPATKEYERLFATAQAVAEPAAPVQP